MEIEIQKIIQNKDQPRQFFDQLSLNELAESIKKHGLLENLVVRSQNDAKTIPKGKYELVCGERRYRACKIAGVTTVTANVREITDKDAYELSLTENLQRDNLTPMEEAKAYEKLKKYNSQGEIAKIVNKNRTRINQMLQLLELPEELHPFFSPFCGVKPLTERHGRELLRFKRFLDKCVKGNTKHCYHIFDDDYYKTGMDIDVFFEKYCYPGKHKYIKDCLLYDAAQGAFFNETPLNKFVDTINWFMHSIIRAANRYDEKNVEKIKGYDTAILGDLHTQFEKLSEEEQNELRYWGTRKSLMPIAHEFYPESQELKRLELRVDKTLHWISFERDCYNWVTRYGVDKKGIDLDMQIWSWKWADEHGLIKDDTGYDEVD